MAAADLEGVFYAVEARRGYESVGDLWSPGFFGADLSLDGEAVALTASTEPWEVIGRCTAEEALAAEIERRQRLVSMADPRAHGGGIGDVGDAGVSGPSWCWRPTPSW